MANNPTVNKVIYGNDTLIDLTEDDVTAGDVVAGKYFHAPSGVRTVGTAVIPEPATATPLMDGTAAVGTATKYAREDHKHPSDTVKANLASPTFTGTPKAPTAASGTNTTQIATTAFVSTAVGKKLDYNATLFTTNTFVPNAQKQLYISKIDNAFFALDKRYSVTVTYDGTNVANVAQFFDGNYEGNNLHIESGKSAVFTLDFSSGTSQKFYGYPYGYIYVSFYNSCIPSTITGRVYNNYANQGVGWHDITFEQYNNTIFRARQSYYGLQTLEITINGSADTPYGYTSPTEIEMQIDRPSPDNHSPIINKYSAQELYYNLTAPKFIGALQGNADTATTATTATKVSAIAGSANADRHVWFSDSAYEVNRNYDDDFKYNPSTNTLTVSNVTGNAATATTATKATQDESGNNIKASYGASLDISGTTLSLKNKNGTALNSVTIPSELPAVTSTDNGKVLQVSSGAWAAQTMPTELPSVTSSDNGKVLTVVSGAWAAATGGGGSSPSPATSNPIMDGTAAVGTSDKYAREDHVHPSDTTKANLASPALTGTPTAPTATAGTNTTQIATTAFVATAVSGKQDTISDLATIRSNATDGETAYTRSTNKVLYYTSVAISAGTGDIATVSNAAITADHVVTSAVFADPSKITSQVTWTTASGSLTLNGTCTAATTANIVLIKKDN